MPFALPVSIPWSAPERKGCLPAGPRSGRASPEPGVYFAPLLAWVRHPSVIDLGCCPAVEQGKDRILISVKTLLRSAGASQIDLCADPDHLLHRHSVAPVIMNRVAVEIGEDRFGHSLNAAVLRNDRFVTDVVSRVLKLERDLPCVSKILQHREEQRGLHVTERDGELLEASTKNFALEPRVLWPHCQCL